MGEETSAESMTFSRAVKSTQTSSQTSFQDYPQCREIEFAVGTLPDMSPIALSMYHVATAGLAEMQTQITELERQGFTRRSMFL